MPIPATSRTRSRARQRDDWLRCAACTHPIALWSERISFDGGFEHRFTNPAGLEFSIGLFAQAPGTQGSPPEHWTDDFSWFVGYEWETAWCGGCGQHLGWSFRSDAVPASTRAAEPPEFAGLILARLV